MLITVQPDPNWQLSLAQLSPSLFFILLLKKFYCLLSMIRHVRYVYSDWLARGTHLLTES